MRTVSRGVVRGVVYTDNLCVCAGAFSRVVKMVAGVFSSVVAALGHHDCIVLSDTSLHHCWSFPPYDWCLQLPQDNHCFSDDKRCNCGRYCVSDLPVGTEWTPLQESGSMLSSDVPDKVADILLSRTRTGVPPSSRLPEISDVMEYKLAALKMATNIASMIIRTDTSILNS